MRAFLVMLCLGGLAGIVSGFRDRGWDSWNDDVLVYVGWLSFAGAIAGLLLGISLACWRRHGWQAGVVALIVPPFLAFLGFLMGAAAAPSEGEMYPDFTEVVWGATGGLIGFGCGLLLVVIAGFTNRFTRNWAASSDINTIPSRPHKPRPPIDMPGVWGHEDDK